MTAANEEIRFLTDKIAAMDKRDAQRKELIATLDEIVASQDRTLKTCKAALAKGDQIEGVDAKLVKSLEDSLEDTKKQLAIWQGRAAFWKRIALLSIPLVAAVAGAIGFVLGAK